ncbi:hypothetical protein [Georgenia faecalis]|uniref:hypothetical protein n=1 Tax=Georgenia faecalis TaxID=2483799 RepID=UPI000FDB9092|nr:hypothetical protein [Georgenia faecalis]
MTAGVFSPAGSTTIDPGPLLALAADVGPDATRSFAQRYATMLPQRISRLQTAVLTGDLEDGFVAALSLHTSSTMVGAHHLAAEAQRLAALLRAGDAAAARAAVAPLLGQATAVTRALDTVAPR